MPKSEARVEGELFSERISRILRETGICNIILAKDYHTDSMLETLRKAIQSVPEKPDFYLIFPVDHPFVKPASIISLCQAIDSPNSIYRPIWAGKRGHPILIPSSLDLFQDDVDQGLKGIIINSQITICEIPVDDPGIIRNVNRPEDIRKEE